MFELEPLKPEHFDEIIGQESQSYFTSVKKRELPSKYMSFKKLNNLIEEDNYDGYKENLKKKLFF